MARAFQVVGQKNLQRQEHVWVKTDRRYKCVLCGAVTPIGETPPSTDNTEWMPERYEELTAEERALCKNPNQ